MMVCSGQHIPGRVMCGQPGHRCNHMRQQYRGCRIAIGVDTAHITADTVQETVQLTLCMVKPAGAGPAGRTAKNGLIAMDPDHAAEFITDQRNRFFPCDFDEWFPRRI